MPSPRAFLAPLLAVALASPAAAGERCAALSNSVDAMSTVYLQHCQAVSAAIDAIAKARAQGDQDALDRAQQSYDAAKKNFDADMATAQLSNEPFGGQPSPRADVSLASQALESGYNNALAIQPAGPPQADASGPKTSGDPKMGSSLKPDVEKTSLPPNGGKYPVVTPEAAQQTRDAQQALNTGQPAAAEKNLDQVLARSPNEQAFALRAQSRAAQGNRDGAVADARQALALNPNDKGAQAILAQYAQADAQARAQGRVAKGLRGLDFGAAAEPERPGAGAASAASAAGGSPQQAIGAAAGASAAAARAAPNTRALLQLAATQLGMGDYSGALLTLQRARNLEPGNAAILNLIAKASNEAKNPRGAIAAAEAALKLNPTDAAALREKAYAEMSLGQNEQALADIEQAVRLEPQNGLAYLYRAMIEEKLGRAADARRDYAAAGSLDPTLSPLAEDGLRRLGGGAAADGRGGPISQRTLFRGGAIALSTLLIVLGLMGTATGRGWATKARAFITPRPEDESADERAPAAATIGPGQFIGGHYRVVRELGRGGMGVVYQAFDETLRRPVAIKQLQREGRGEPLELERFLHEARMVAQLKHPHIAEIHSVVGGGDLLLVFEYVEGQSLDRFVGNGRRLPAADARRIVAEIAGALEYAHAQKIVHRDLKPSNVMIAKNGAAKVMDFGIAHQSRSGAAATRTTYVSGTPPYMSPEQMMGSVSPAADVYALAVMTYEMLTGRLPFDGPDYMEQKISRRYPPATTLDPALPPAVDALLARALEPDPSKRLASARDFARALAEAFGATPSRV